MEFLNQINSASRLVEDANNRLVTDTQISTWDAKATTDYVNTKINELIANSPAALDTLNELSKALNDDPYFATTTATILATKVDKVAGMGLSTNDYTNTEKSKLAGIADNANNYTHPANHAPSIITQDASNRFVTDSEKSTWNAKATTSIATTSANGLMSSADKTKLDTVAANANNYTHPATHAPSIIAQDTSNRFVTDAQITAWTAKATTAYVDTQIANLVASSPDTLNTLNELATALGNDPNFATSVATQIGTKVDKVDGKGLSANDYTNAEKTKLANMDAFANNYVHPATHAPSIIAQDTSNRFVTDSEKTTWNAKASTATATMSTDGLMSSADKTKLANMDAFANNYVHPANHAPSIITQDANNRFVTDAQITAWNARLNGRKGAGQFVGNNAKVTIAHGLGVTPTAVQVTATSNSNGTLGEVWCEYDATNIYVGNTGSSTAYFNWLAII